MAPKANRIRSAVARLLYLACSLFVLSMLLLSRSAAAQTRVGEEVCDARADYELGMENYGETITLHLAILQADPHDALAHYHLGFAYGMLGQCDQELEHYRQALSLGLADWSLLLNLGLAYFEQGNSRAALAALGLSAMMGPNNAEPHYNLGLVLEREGMLAEAQREILLSLALDPSQPDARNMLALIYAEVGNGTRAREEWLDLLRVNRGYGPPLANLKVLDQQTHSAQSESRGEGSSSPGNDDPVQHIPVAELNLPVNR